MALTPTEEAQTRQLIAQEAPLLSLASNEPTITSKLGATKVNLSQLPAATVPADADIYLVRQGTTDKSVAGSVLKSYVQPGAATDTTAGVVALAVAANYPSVSDVEAATPAYVAKSSQAHGQCRLAKSGANLVLSPYNGNKLIINGVMQTIPAAGVSLAPTGLIPLTATTTRSIASNVATIGHAALSAPVPVGATISVYGLGGAAAYNGMKVVTASTTTSTSYAAVAANESSTADTGGRFYVQYYRYEYMAGSVMTAEASTVAHATDATTGVEIKTGDATRTLTGMFTIGTGVVFVDTANQRFVRSWFNDPGVAGLAWFSATRSTASNATYVELGSEIRNEFLCWAGETVQVGGSGSSTQTAGNVTNNTAVSFDSVNPETGSWSTGYTPAGGQGLPYTINFPKTGLSEGYHYATLMGSLGGVGTGTWTGATPTPTAPSVSTLTTFIKK